MLRVPVTTPVIVLMLLLYLIEGYWAFSLFRRKKFLFLLLWPVVIYGIGPLIAATFGDLPIVSNYVIPDYALAESLLFFAFVGILYGLDHRGALSSSIERFATSTWMRTSAESGLFRGAFFVLGILAIPLQLYWMARFGTVFTGQYTSFEWLRENGTNWESRAAGSEYGILAGLYELFYTMTVVLALNTNRPFNLRKPYFWMYFAVLVLRLLSGIRLLIIKELSVLLFVSWQRGKITLRGFAVASVIIVLAGSVVGFLRGGSTGSNEYAQRFGPLFSIAAESAVSAVTFSIAYDTASMPRPEPRDEERPRPLAFLAASVIPSFIYNLFADKNEIMAFAPYEWARFEGYDFYTPIGGMGLFSNVLYFVPNPLGALATLVLLVVLVLRLRYYAQIKSVLILALIVSALNFWRDPIDIAVKLWFNSAFFILFLGIVLRLRVHPPPATEGEPATPDPAPVKV